MSNFFKEKYYKSVKLTSVVGAMMKNVRKARWEMYAITPTLLRESST